MMHLDEDDCALIDLTAEEVIDALKTCPIEVERVDASRFVGWYSKPVITYKGERMYLSRTDLYDDVATGLCERWDAEGWRKHYLAKARDCLGGRLHTWSDGRLGFSVIDAYTDG